MSSTNTKALELSGRQQLAASGLTQAEIAEIAGVTQQAVSQWFSKQKSPGRKSAGLLWDKLKIPPPSWDLPDAPEPSAATDATTAPARKREASETRRPATRRTSAATPKAERKAS